MSDFKWLGFRITNPEHLQPNLFWPFKIQTSPDSSEIWTLKSRFELFLIFLVTWLELPYTPTSLESKCLCILISWIQWRSGPICREFSMILKIHLAAIFPSENWITILSKNSAYQHWTRSFRISNGHKEVGLQMGSEIRRPNNFKSGPKLLHYSD